LEGIWLADVKHIYWILIGQSLTVSVRSYISLSIGFPWERQETGNRKSKECCLYGWGSVCVVHLVLMLWNF
jgi:hypothetical protein